MFINRSYNRTENDDFNLNVLPLLGNHSEAVPFYHDGYVIGWKIKVMYQ